MTKEEHIKLLEHSIKKIRQYFEDRIVELDNKESNIQNLSAGIECRENYTNILHILIFGHAKEKNIWNITWLN